MDGVAYSYKEIISRPLQQLRRSVAHKFLHGQLTIDSFLDHATEIQDYVTAHDPASLEGFKAELDLAINALGTGQVDKSPELERPAFQLLWASVMATALSDEKVIEKWPEEVRGDGFEDSALWEAVTESPYMQQELSETMLEVANAVKRPHVSVNWGAPPSGYPNVAYYYNPGDDYINLDPLWGLIFGIEHARGATMHEIAHGQGSISFTPKIQILHDRMEEMKLQQDKWEKEDYFKFAKLYAEWKTRFLIWDEAENNYANRFAANRGTYSAQDYGRSLNFVESTISGSILAASPVIVESDMEKKLDTTTPDVMKQLMNFKRALRYVFFKNNDFIEDTEEGWSEIGLDLAMLIDSMPDAKAKGLTARQVLDEIIPLCEQLEQSQPQAHERMLGAEYFYDRVKECAENRNQIIDDIFERFAAPFLPEIMQQVDNHTEEILKIIEAIEQAKAEGKQTIYIEGLGEISICDVPGKTPGEVKGTCDKEGESDLGKGHGSVLTDKLGPTSKKNVMTKDESSMSGGGGGKGPSKTFSDALPKIPQGGDLKGYFEIIAAYGPAIRKLSRQFREIEERFFSTRDNEFPRNVLIPEDGDISRFDQDSLRERLVRQHTGQSIGEDDFEHFRRNMPQRMNYPPADVEIWVDGSGSMTGEPVRVAITAGCILYEAAKAAGINVYIGMLGDPHPLHIAKPDDNHTEIGKKIDAAKAGAGGGKDHLLPALKASLEFTTQAKGVQRLVGNSHVFIVSDGGFSDCYYAGAEVLKKVELIARKCPHMTMDYVLIGDRAASIIPVVHKVNRASGGSKMGYRIIKDISEIQKALTEILAERLKNTKESDGLLFTNKQSEFRAVQLG